MIDYPIERQLEFVCMERDALEARVAALTAERDDAVARVTVVMADREEYMRCYVALTAALAMVRQKFPPIIPNEAPRERTHPRSFTVEEIRQVDAALDAAGGAE